MKIPFGLLIVVNILLAGTFASSMAYDLIDWAIFFFYLMLPGLVVAMVKFLFFIPTVVKSGWVLTAVCVLTVASTLCGFAGAVLVGGDGDPVGWLIGFSAGFLVCAVLLPLIFLMIFGWFILLFVRSASANHPDNHRHRHDCCYD